MSPPASVHHVLTDFARLREQFPAPLLDPGELTACALLACTRGGEEDEPRSLIGLLAAEAGGEDGILLAGGTVAGAVTPSP